MKTLFLIAAFLVCVTRGDSPKKRYLLYDCNPGEGFNLRRDVYMRIANLVRSLNEDKACAGDEWTLVLPPWGRIGYHWKERELEQSRIPWSKFFDVESLRGFVPVMEYTDYLEEVGARAIDEIWYLQNYAEGWGGKWEEKMHERECIDPPVYQSDGEGKIRGWFWGYEEQFAKKFKCVSVQGQSGSFRVPLCGGNTSAVSVFLDRGENMMHDLFGGKNYWDCRRSMVFSSALRETADKFRADFLDSDDVRDKTVLPANWKENKCKRGDAIGGPYIAAHLRRKDFLYARKEAVPSLEKAAAELREKMKEHGVGKVFIATDGSKEEVRELEKLLPEMVTFEPTPAQMKEFKMGGVAIIDQIICSHARYFTGTKESTFSFRIQEEREIMCFEKKKTFNRICGDGEKKDCEQPTNWKIVWESDKELWQ